MKKIDGVVAAFNVNIDATLHDLSSHIENWI